METNNSYDSNKIISNFSFKFSKKTQPSKVDRSKIQDVDVIPNRTDFIASVEGKQIQSSIPEKKEVELVIPLITKNVWRLPKDQKTTDKVSEAKSQMSLEEQALKEIIDDSKRANDDIQTKMAPNDSLVVPLLFQNKCPEGFETDDRLDVTLRPDPSNLDDYDKIPIEHFGLATLRGMGWKPGDGIGRTNKKCVAPIEVNLRPRGLGLGANRKDLEAMKARAAGEETFPLVVGGYVCVVEGNSKGQYGEIQHLDDDTGRVVLKMSPTDKLVTLPEIFLKGVSKKEFEKGGKDLSKAPDSKNNSEHKESSRESSKERSSKRRKHKHRSPSVENEHREEHKKKKRKDRHKDRSKSPDTMWIHPQLRVRIIDQKFKKGRYFNTKVVIEDVISPTTCICKTDEGNVLEDIDSKMLETVIPRTDPSYVMVLEGKYRGQIASILARDKASCKATMHLLPEHRQILTLSYDCICEYVGDVSAYE